MTTLFTGVVESRKDPLKLGRCKVRIVGLHSPKLSDLSTEDLPWAIPMTQITSASVSGIGLSPIGVVEGSWVIVFFADGEEYQQPIMIGSLPGMPLAPTQSITSQGQAATPGGQAELDTSLKGAESEDTSSPSKVEPPIPENPNDTDLFLGSLTKADYEKLCNTIGFKESGNVYNTVNSIGFLGRFQFGYGFLLDNKYIKTHKGTNKKTLEDDSNWTGKDGMTSQTAFLASKPVQDKLMEAMCRNNYRILGITPSTPKEKTCGLLMAAHLAGAVGVKNWMDGKPTKDAYGTSADAYYKIGYGCLTNAVPGEKPTTENKNDKDITADKTPAQIDNMKKGVGIPQPSPSNPSGMEASIGFRDVSGKYPKSSHLNEPDTNRLSRNQKTKETIVASKTSERMTGNSFGNSNSGTWDQPQNPYNAKYPFNHVLETESGHVIEYDDTPGAERVHVYHTSGTFIEIDANGTLVSRVKGNNYQIIDNDGYIAVSGQCIVNVSGDSTLCVLGNLHAQVTGKVNVTSEDDVNMSSQKNITLQSEQNIQMQCKDFVVAADSASFNIKQKYDVLAGSNINLDGAAVYTQSKTAAPKPFKNGTWNVFNPSNVIKFPQPTARETEESVGLEGLSKTDLRTQGYNPENPAAAPEPIKMTEPAPTLAPSTPPEGCESLVEPISNSVKLSINYTVGKVLVGSAKPDTIVAQHGKSAAKIACSLKKICIQVLEPLLEKYGSKMIITSTLRRSPNKYSQKNKDGTLKMPPSKHELGQAVDMQFSDCKNYNDYVVRAKEVAALVKCDFFLLENDKGTTWIHIQHNS